MPPTPRTRAELNREGMTRRELEAALRQQTLEKVRRGLYAEPLEGSAVARHVRLVRGTVPAIHPDAVVSHLSAAAMHGMPLAVGWLGPVVVTRASGVHGRRTPTLDVRVGALTPADVVEVGGVRCTSLARTAADLARDLPYEWGVIGCDHVLHRGVARAELDAHVDAARRLRGSARLRAAADFADPGAESPNESVSRVQFSRMDLPTPETQFEVRDAEGRFVARCDFGWRGHRLVGEADGKAKYGDLLRPGETASDAVMAEKRREERIRQAGFWIVRWGWEEAWQRDVLERLVRNAMANAPGT